MSLGLARWLCPPKLGNVTILSYPILSLNVELTASPRGPFTVAYSTTGGTAFAVSGVVKFAAGQKTATVAVTWPAGWAPGAEAD